MIRPIVHDPFFLVQKSEPVEEADKAVITDLLDTLRANLDGCVGMAANMIGIKKRIIVFCRGSKQYVMVNPQITSGFEPYETEEGCLSLDGVRPCTRYKEIEVDYLDYVDYKYKNNIIEQFYQGKPIEEGTELVKGSKIVLRVGIGQDKSKVKVPNLIGKPAADAKRLLNLAGLNIGTEEYEDNDSLKNMCIRRMSPGPSSGSVDAGTCIHLVYHSSKTLDFKKAMNELLHEDSLANLPQMFEIETNRNKESTETTDYEFEDSF